ncbi:hypothetical protein, partial [Geodermatophilus sp. CPCC 206100]|uniref:hypothetical protein n=1 Tax=Geodermatophilus sp. CPCC 206100 TaxID=3020054 RepID=UPI003B0089B8
MVPDDGLAPVRRPALTATGSAQRAPAGRRLAAAAGVLAAAVGLGTAELAAGVLGPQSSPVVAVADAVVALTPEPVTRAAIDVLGEQDKVALVAGVLVLTGLAGLGLGVASARRRGAGVAGIAAFG